VFEVFFFQHAQQCSIEGRQYKGNLTAAKSGKLTATELSLLEQLAGSIQEIEELTPHPKFRKFSCKGFR